MDQPQKDYLTERIGVRTDIEIHNTLVEISKEKGVEFSEVLRDVVHYGIKKYHHVVKRGIVNKANGY